MEERRLSAILDTPQMRSMRLIGNANPRYRWERYWKTEEQLKAWKKPMHVQRLQESSRRILLTLIQTPVLPKDESIGPAVFVY